MSLTLTKPTPQLQTGCIATQCLRIYSSVNMRWALIKELPYQGTVCRHVQWCVRLHMGLCGHAVRCGCAPSSLFPEILDPLPFPQCSSLFLPFLICVAFRPSGIRHVKEIHTAPALNIPQNKKMPEKCGGQWAIADLLFFLGGGGGLNSKGMQMKAIGCTYVPGTKQVYTRAWASTRTQCCSDYRMPNLWSHLGSSIS